MAREIAAETAEAAPDPELSLVHGLLVRFALPVVTRIPRQRIPLVTWSLALVLVAVFIFELRGAGLDAAVAHLGYGPAHRGLWAAVKATFAHAGWWHLLGNVYFLLAFGDGVEQRVPRWLLPPAFVVAGTAALLVDGALHADAVIVGASGGVAAVIGACVVLQPRAQVAIHLWPLALRLSMRSFFVLQLLFQVVMGAAHLPGSAWIAQLVGLALGAGAAALLHVRQRAT
jgi:membrane associated rhomboid family serine protease